MKDQKDGVAVKSPCQARWPEFMLQYLGTKHIWLICNPGMKGRNRKDCLNMLEGKNSQKLPSVS